MEVIKDCPNATEIAMCKQAVVYMSSQGCMLLLRKQSAPSALSLGADVPPLEKARSTLTLCRSFNTQWPKDIFAITIHHLNPLPSLPGSGLILAVVVR